MEKELAKILLNISYLFIGGVLLTGIMQQNVSITELLLIGGIVPLLMILVAIMLLWLSEKTENKKNKKGVKKWQ
jgi:amino acid permease